MNVEQPPAHRRIYALQILAKAGVEDNERLLEAFVAVPREKFAGQPPWAMNDLVTGSYRVLSSRDPVVLYQDILVGLDTEKGINNGSPSLHAGALDALGIREGETVVHMGCGTGYYTAIMAELAGPSGRVIAVDYDEALAGRAKSNLAGYRNVEVIHGNAAEWPRQDADVVYANFALDHPPAAWIDNLAMSGRLLFPLGIPAGESKGNGSFSRHAAFLMIDRQTRGYGARFLLPVSFIWAEGLEPTPPGRHAGLEVAFRARGLRRVRSFRWRRPPTDAEWYGEEGWGRSFDEV
jgi:protein-L-isoaspartate(D-aspartate) O-methyltransferase